MLINDTLSQQWGRKCTDFTLHLVGEDTSHCYWINLQFFVLLCWVFSLLRKSTR